MKDKVILGIDPGTLVMGYGIISIQNDNIKLESAGTIHLKSIQNHPLKLKKIFEQTNTLLERFKPDDLAIEAPFFGKNVQSMLKLGRAQGVAIAAALQFTIPVFEYSPKKIKQSITGNGNASKQQVAEMLKNILQFTILPKNLDATDALATALCHHYQSKNNFNGGKKSWTSFIKENPERVVRI